MVNELMPAYLNCHIIIRISISMEYSLLKLSSIIFLLHINSMIKMIRLYDMVMNH